MLPFKDGPVKLAPVAACLLIVGCASSPDRTPPVLGQSAIRPPLAARAQSGPELRIPIEPGVAARPAQDQAVTQAGAQVPVKPPLALDDGSGPPLKAPNAAISPAANLRSLHREAAQQYATIDSYIVRMRRREQINGKDKPEEILYVKFRKQPWSIYFKWLGKEANGREVLYVKGQYEDKLHTLLAAGDMPLMPAGKRIALSPDSSLVRSSSRHTIHEAGIGVLIDRFGALLDAAEKGDNRYGTVRHLGLVKRPEFEAPCEATEQEIRPGSEPLLPRGGRRLWLFDTTSKLPVLMTTWDGTGHEVEYYCYDHFQYPVRLDNDDFNPDKLWNQSKTNPAKPNSR